MEKSSELVDAYAHAGVPRFGTAKEALRTLRRAKVDRTVLVLGPGVPDLMSVCEARQIGGQDVRCMGIPFGETEEQRTELAGLQIRVGISGMRLMPFEVVPNARVLNMLGERGLWLFAINPQEQAAVTRALIVWLEDHPNGRIAAPHFLCPRSLDEASEDPGATRELLAHPRFHAILSRHGGVGSREPYPHRDLLPWVEEVAGIVTWDRIMWGSEYPVLFWRNELLEEGMAWIDAVGAGLSEADRAKFMGGNASRLLFDGPAPDAEDVEIPAWVEDQWDRNRIVPLLPRTPLDVPMEAYAVMLSAYLERSVEHRRLRLADYLVDVLESRAEH